LSRRCSFSVSSEKGWVVTTMSGTSMAVVNRGVWHSPCLSREQENDPMKSALEEPRAERTQSACAARCGTCATCLGEGQGSCTAGRERRE
jgi:hypothetical protein